MPGGIIRIPSYKPDIFVVSRKRELAPIFKYGERFASEKATNTSDVVAKVDCDRDVEIRTKFSRLKQGEEGVNELKHVSV